MALESPPMARQQAKSGFAWHQHVDLLALIMLSLIQPLLLWLPVGALRVVSGLVLVLLAPGYVLTTLMFTRDDVDRPARLAISIGVSVALLPLFALVLNVLPWGFRPTPMLLLLTSWVVLFAVLALGRRIWTTDEAAAVSVISVCQWVRSLGRSSRAAALILAVASISTIAWSANVLSASATRRATEFYVLGDRGEARDYPRQATVGEPVTLHVGIENHEARAARYHVMVRSGKEQLSRVDSIAIESGSTWAHDLQVTFTHAGSDRPVDLLLYRDGETQPLRQLQLWLDIHEAH